MDTQIQPGQYRNISQRIAASYSKQLVDYYFPLENYFDQVDRKEKECSFRDLHGFFKSLYDRLFHDPELFGLPLTEDIYIIGDGSESQDQKQEKNRQLQKPKDIIITIMDFLMVAGVEGNIEGQGLYIRPEIISETMMKPKIKKKVLQGLESVGLKLNETGVDTILTNPLFSAMMPALKIFATHCSQYSDKAIGKFHFARCDFKILQEKYDLNVTDIYQVFNPNDLARIQQLHTFFTDRGYKPFLHLGGVSGWVVKYQGKRQVKASPFFEISYQERRMNPLEVFIKCASANRIVPLIEKQSNELQDDFLKRLNKCRGKDCDWCKNRKGLGPIVFHHYNGERVTACWYTNPDVKNFNDEAVELIKQYAIMHEQLVYFTSLINNLTTRSEPGGFLSGAGGT